MRLYVTGGTGLVGSNIIRLARQRGDIEIIASTYRHEPEWDYDYTLAPLDMTDHDAIKASIRKYKPDVVIHSAANLDLLWLINNRKRAWHMTVGGTRAFAEACREVGARFIFVSSDWVFDGREALVDEESPPHPVNFYGIMKMASERDLASMDDLNYGVARMAGIYGLNYSNPSLLRKDNGLGFDLGNFTIDRLSQGKVAPVWMGPKVNEVAHASLASDCADLVLRLATHEACGIFHCFGSEPVSRLDFAYQIADLFDADRALVAPVPTDSAVLDAMRHVDIPYRLVASVEKTATALGRTPYTIQEGLQAFKQEWDAFHA